VDPVNPVGCLGGGVLGCLWFELGLDLIPPVSRAAHLARGLFWFAGWAAIAWTAGTLRRRISVDDEGLCVQRWAFFRQRYPWPSIQGLRQTYGGHEIVTEAGTIAVFKNLPGRQALLHAVRRRLAEPEPPGVPLAATEIERLLDVAPGASLTVRLPSMMVRQGISAAIFVFLALRGSPYGEPVFLAYGLFMALSSYLSWLGQGQLAASAEGLVLKTRRRRLAVGWDEVLAVTEAPEGCGIATARGDMPLRSNHRRIKPFAAAIQRVLSAREAGAALPRMSEASDAALSDAGLSRAEP
jgi:uncharacterized protein YjiS (DUF1127 family)